MTAESSISPDTFRQSMRLLAGGVCIAATSLGGARLGLTVTAVCSPTVSPPTIIVCINRGAGAHGLMQASKRVSINFLAAHHVGLAERFSSPVIRGEDRFEAGQWRSMSSGSLALIGALAVLDCVIIEELVVGQHSAFHCEVKSALLHGEEKPPLVHFNERSHCKRSGRRLPEAEPSCARKSDPADWQVRARHHRDVAWDAA